MRKYSFQFSFLKNQFFFYLGAANCFFFSQLFGPRPLHQRMQLFALLQLVGVRNRTVPIEMELERSLHDVPKTGENDARSCRRGKVVFLVIFKELLDLYFKL